MTDKPGSQGGDDAATAALDDLARRYLDLWQDQVSALAADEDLAEAMTHLLNPLAGALAGPGLANSGATGPASGTWGAFEALQPWMLGPAWAETVAAMAKAGETAQHGRRQNPDPAGRDAAGRDAAGRDAAGRDAAGGHAAGRDGPGAGARTGNRAGAPRPEAAAAAPDERDRHLDELTRRIAVLEQRIAELEGGPGGRGGDGDGGGAPGRRKGTAGRGRSASAGAGKRRS